MSVSLNKVAQDGLGACGAVLSDVTDTFLRGGDGCPLPPLYILRRFDVLVDVKVL